jgi:hypothetical protein
MLINLQLLSHIDAEHACMNVDLKPPTQDGKRKEATNKKQSISLCCHGDLGYHVIGQNSGYNDARLSCNSHATK